MMLFVKSPPVWIAWILTATIAACGGERFESPDKSDASAGGMGGVAGASSGAAGFAGHATGGTSSDGSVGGASGEGGQGGSAGSAGVRNIVFVTSIKIQAGALGGLAGADAFCMQRAAAVGLPGNYVAWLSSTTVDAKVRLGTARGWRRPDGNPVADTLSDLVDGKIWYPPLMDETGTEVGSGPEYAVTATNAAGTFHKDATIGSCEDYTSMIGSVIHGWPYGGTAAWTSAAPTSCDTYARLYCFGVDHQVPVDQPAEPGRLFFVTAQPFNLQAGVGIAAADELCMDQAALGGLVGPYHAFLATTASSAQARFPDWQDAQWRRVDGVSLGTLSPPLAAPNVTSTGLYISRSVWTGAASPNSPGSQETTCDDWTGTTGNAMHGLSTLAVDRFFHSGDNRPCVAQGDTHLYCGQSAGD